MKIALKEFQVKKAVGIDTNNEKINLAKNNSGEFICQDIRDSDLSEATVILFWFTDEDIIKNRITSYNVCYTKLLRMIIPLIMILQFQPR